MSTPRTEIHIQRLKQNYEVSGCDRTLDFAKSLEREIYALQGATARLCRAVSRRMMPDEPTHEDRMELREAFDAASEFLHNAVVEASVQIAHPDTLKSQK